LYAIKIADLYNPEIKNKLLIIAEKRQYHPILPCPESVYDKEIVKENDPIYQRNKIAKKKYFEDNSNEKSKLKPIDSLVGNKENNVLKLNHAMDNLNENKKARYSQNMTETTSTSSKEDLQYPNSGNEDKMSSPTDKTKSDLNIKIEAGKKIMQPEFRLFSSRPRSRFEFVKSNPQYENIEIPQFILHLIFKKSTTYKLSKNMRHLEDLIYSDKSLEMEYRNKNPWAQFIIENKSDTNPDRKNDTEKNTDEELIEDFDHINNFIFNKFKHINKNYKI